MSMALVSIVGIVVLYALSMIRSGTMPGCVVVTLYAVIYYVKVCFVAGPTVLGRRASFEPPSACKQYRGQIPGKAFQ